MRECSRSDGTGVSLVGNPRRRGEEQLAPSMSCSLSKLRGLVESRRDGPSARRNFQSCGGTNWCVNKVMAVLAKSPCAPVTSPRVNLDTTLSSRERVNGLNRNLDAEDDPKFAKKRSSKSYEKDSLAGEGRRGPSLRASSHPNSARFPWPVGPSDGEVARWSFHQQWRRSGCATPVAYERVHCGSGCALNEVRAGCVSTQRFPHWRVAPLGSRNEGDVHGAPRRAGRACATDWRALPPRCPRPASCGEHGRTRRPARADAK